MTDGHGSFQDSAGGVVAFRLIHNWNRINPMDRADLFRVYELGGAMHRLSEINSDTTLANYFGPYVAAERALDILLGADPQIKIDLSLGPARELKNVITRLETTFFRDKDGKFKYPDDADIKLEYRSSALRTALQNFEAVFRAEMQAASTYLVPKRGAFSTRDLVDAFDRTFLPEMHGAIGEPALAEYRNGGRCFAFGLWTAAGYHSCRAVEAVLRPYYEKLTGKEASDGKTWGALIEGLEQVSADPKPNEKTVFYLKQLKDSERNPLMHVRVVLDEQDADLLLSSAKIVIVLMARELSSIEKAAKDAPLLSIIEGDKSA